MEEVSESYSREEASRFMRLAIVQMQKYNIPNIPENYSVWFQYVSGGNKDLTSRINQLIKSKSTFSAAIVKELQNLGKGVSENTVRDLQDQVRSLILDLQGKMRNSDTRMASEVQAISENADQLQPFASERVVNKVSKALVSAARSLEKVVESQRHNLEKAGNQLAELGQVAVSGHTPDENDFLTGLVTKITFDKQLSHWLEGGHNELKRLCIVYIETLELDAIQQKTNSLVVDDIIRYTAMAIKSAVRGRDLAARIDSHRFALLLPDTQIKGAEVVVGRIFEAFPKQGLKQKSNHQDIGRIRVAASVLFASPHLSIGRIEERLQKGLRRAIVQKDNGLDIIP